LAFEALAHVARLQFSDVPPHWSPLIFAFDPDLPLFPLLYFHVLSSNLKGQRPKAEDRAYGYVRSVNIDLETRVLTAEIICNKDVTSPANSTIFLDAVKEAVGDRLGVTDPVTLSDINGVFPAGSSFADRLPVLEEMWHRVVGSAYGGALPFGKFTDPVWGLAFAFATYRSGGRKAEMIQTHYFCTHLGEPIANSAGVPIIQFNLLPTWEELTDLGNPLALFPRFAKLVEASRQFCSLPVFAGFDLTNWSYTGFTGKGGAAISTDYFKGLVAKLKQQYQGSLNECFNALYKGPTRTLMFLMFLNDIRQINASSPSPAGAKNPRLTPAKVSAQDAAEIAINLGHQQAKKVISLYAQQSHANRHCFPMDTWITAMMAHPLNVAEYNYKTGDVRHSIANDKRIKDFITAATQLGKVERLLWETAQARKVHSPACDDAIWCIKASGEFLARGANPLACKACHSAIRNVCPAYSAIKDRIVGFNGVKSVTGMTTFNLVTSANNNTVAGQYFVKCVRSNGLIDEDTAFDSSKSFAAYPAHGHVSGNPMSVQDFVGTY